ncbi:TPA: hypothetical protein ACIQK0_004211, partial [Bacillus pacificus]
DAPRDCRSNSFKEKLTEEGGQAPPLFYNIGMLYVNRSREVISIQWRLMVHRNKIKRSRNMINITFK